MWNSTENEMMQWYRDTVTPGSALSDYETWKELAIEAEREKASDRPSAWLARAITNPENPIQEWVGSRLEDEIDYFIREFGRR